MTPDPILLEKFVVHLKDRLLFDIDTFRPVPGTSTVITGTTGSGKSVLLRSLTGLLSGPFTVKGSMKLHGFDAYVDGRKTSLETWRKILHQGITFVPAETAQAMNPALSLEQNLRLICPDARPMVESRLKEYFNLDFTKFAKQYPDEVSGGELQRITLMILLSRPANLVYLDEPTVNLDRQLRKRFIDFLNGEILDGKGKTVLMASHDLDFVRALKLDVILRLENQKLHTIDKLPENAARVKEEDDGAGAEGLQLQDVSQHYSYRGLFGDRPSWAYKHLDVNFRRSHIYGITGPSGCGKTSMVRGILRLVDGTTGTITLGGQDLVTLKPHERGKDPSAFLPFRRRIAIVQQDSRFSFFPDLKIRDSLKQIDKAWGGTSFYEEAKVTALMDKIQLRRVLLDNLPRALSSGEMKRMDIVRALAAEPDVILLDEPFAHIDFETRALVMKAISDYLKEKAAILIVVTHEDFDLQYFVQTEYDFLSKVRNNEPVKGFATV
jgi:ABC-type multidrug transport system ATPase subunit